MKNIALQFLNNIVELLVFRKIFTHIFGSLESYAQHISKEYKETKIMVLIKSCK